MPAAANRWLAKILNRESAERLSYSWRDWLKASINMPKDFRV